MYEYISAYELWRAMEEINSRAARHFGGLQKQFCNGFCVIIHVEGRSEFVTGFGSLEEFADKYKNRARSQPTVQPSLPQGCEKLTPGEIDQKEVIDNPCMSD